MSGLKTCNYCLVASNWPTTHRTYGFTLGQHITSAFSQLRQCHALLAPFEGLWSIGENNKFEQVPDWYNQFVQRRVNQQYSQEIWDGELFQKQPIWVKYGMRSLVLIVSLDWFPPYKSRDYSIGVFTASPANLTCVERSQLWSMWVLAILEGPSEPKHCFHMLEQAFVEIKAIEENGIIVYDALSQSKIRVHATCALVAADIPACAKLGNLIGHGSFRACTACYYKGCVCGCKGNNDDIPARWNNVDYGMAALEVVQYCLATCEKSTGGNIFVMDRLIHI